MPFNGKVEVRVGVRLVLQREVPPFFVNRLFDFMADIIPNGASAELVRFAPVFAPALKSAGEYDIIFSFFGQGYYALEREARWKMATSSIFANFEIKDPKAVRVFVDALCSDKPWPQPKVVVRETQRTEDNFRRFLERGPYAVANG